MIPSKMTLSVLVMMVSVSNLFVLAAPLVKPDTWRLQYQTNQYVTNEHETMKQETNEHEINKDKMHHTGNSTHQLRGNTDAHEVRTANNNGAVSNLWSAGRTASVMSTGRLTKEGCSCMKRWRHTGVGFRNLQWITNYCGNPDNSPEGEWCWVENTRVEACRRDNQGPNNGEWGFCAAPTPQSYLIKIKGRRLNNKDMCLNSLYSADHTKLGNRLDMESCDKARTFEVSDWGSSTLQFKLKGSNMCIDNYKYDSGGKSVPTLNVKDTLHFWECDPNNSNQKWTMNDGGQIERKDDSRVCLDVPGNAYPHVWNCDTASNPNQQFELLKP